MGYESKQDWVSTILLDRLRYVMKEECELYFSFFEHDVKDIHFHKMTNREEALSFWRQFKNRSTGGDTAIGNVINYMNQKINESRKSGIFYNLNHRFDEDTPEVLIINDGQLGLGI